MTLQIGIHHPLKKKHPKETKIVKTHIESESHFHPKIHIIGIFFASFINPLTDVRMTVTTSKIRKAHIFRLRIDGTLIGNFTSVFTSTFRHRYPSEHKRKRSPSPLKRDKRKPLTEEEKAAKLKEMQVRLIFVRLLAVFFFRKTPNGEILLEIKTLGKPRRIMRRRKRKNEKRRLLLLSGESQAFESDRFLERI